MQPSTHSSLPRPSLPPENARDHAAVDRDPAEGSAEPYADAHRRTAGLRRRRLLERWSAFGSLAAASTLVGLLSLAPPPAAARSARRSEAVAQRGARQGDSVRSVTDTFFPEGGCNDGERGYRLEVAPGAQPVARATTE